MTLAIDTIDEHGLILVTKCVMNYCQGNAVLAIYFTVRGILPVAQY